jgi:heptosyltransferase-2
MAARVLIRAPNWLGDAIMAIPAISDVRRHFEAATLAVAAPGPIAPLFRAVPAVDEVMTLSGARGLAILGRGREDAQTIASGRFDVAILLPNSFGAAWTLHRAGVAERWGYGTDWRGGLLTRAVPRPRRARGAVHHAAYYQDLVRGLGMASETSPARLTISPTVRQKGVALLESHGVGRERRLVGLAPGAAYGAAKRWPPERYADLIASLHRDSATTCVLVGARSDRRAARAIESSLAARGGARPPVTLVGLTDLETLLGVVACCRAFVSNDSGAMHVAAAAGVHVTAIFGPSDERETAPLGPHTVVAEPVWCRPCLLRECPIDHRCMTGVSVARVLASVEARLDVGEAPGS